MLPAVNPLAAPNVLCPTCGKVVPPEPVREIATKTGPATVKRVTEVLYFCVNEERNCNWFVTATLEHVRGEGPFAFKPEELARRREDAAALKQMQERRDEDLRVLLALLPHLKDIVHMYRSASQAPAFKLPVGVTVADRTGSSVSAPTGDGTAEKEKEKTEVGA